MSVTAINQVVISNVEDIFYTIFHQGNPGNPQVVSCQGINRKGKWLHEILNLA